MKHVALFCFLVIVSSMVWQAGKLGERDAEVEYLNSEIREYSKMIDRIVALDEKSLARDLVIEWRGSTGR